MQFYGRLQCFRVKCKSINVTLQQCSQFERDMLFQTQTADYVKRYQKYSYKLGNIRQFQTKLFLFPNYKLLIIINNLNKTKNTLKKSKYLTLTLITIHQIGSFLLPLMSFDVNIYRFKLKQLCFSFTFINFGIRFIADHFLNSYI